MKRILEAWKSYERDILIPARAGAIQIQETRRAFYAGAQTLFFAIMNMLDPGQEATDADLVKMDEIEQELKSFVEDVKRGRA